MNLDHVAIATRNAPPVLASLIGELGATPMWGGSAPGFRPMTVRLGEGSAGMSLEVLEPWLVEQNDFLERFLARSGDGPHHLTFKVDDLAAELGRVRATGLTLIGVNLESPTWKEAFIHPKEVGGTVVQLAQSAWGEMPWEEMLAAARAEGPGGMSWWGELPPRASKAAVLTRVVLATRDLDASLALFGDLLEGTTEEKDETGAELAWPGGRIRLEVSKEKAPGIDRLECVHDVPGERLIGGARFLMIEG